MDHGGRSFSHGWVVSLAAVAECGSLHPYKSRSHQRVADGRQFLREALDGPVSFTPDGNSIDLRVTLGSVG
jgi:hypothetical protein